MLFCYFAQMEKDQCIMVCAPTTFEMQMKKKISICLLEGKCLCKAKKRFKKK
jgi:hypothetical protein